MSVQLSRNAEQQFSRLRERYFPPALNYLPAHITMFHHLPDEHGSEIDVTIQSEAAQESSMVIAVTGLRNLGRGVAFTLECPRLATLRQRLAKSWDPWLTPQDRQKFKPHLTVQNKVAPDVARQTLGELQAAFAPREIEACGLYLWIYRNGPWEHLKTFPFSARASDVS